MAWNKTKIKNKKIPAGSFVFEKIKLDNFGNSQLDKNR